MEVFLMVTVTELSCSQFVSLFVLESSKVPRLSLRLSAEVSLGVKDRHPLCYCLVGNECVLKLA